MIDPNFIVRLGKATAAMFGAPRKRLAVVLDPVFWQRYARSWSERTLHGNVAPADRSGYVLAAADMRGLAPRLFEPVYYVPRPETLPAPNEFEVGRFLGDLIARSESSHFVGRVATAIKVATKRIGKGALGTTLEQHARDLVAIAAEYVDLYCALVRGDFPAAGKIVAAVDDAAVRARLVRIAARQRVIWSCADLHRVAARGKAAASHHIAWFLRPIISTDKANTVLRALNGLTRVDDRLDNNMALTKKVNPDATRARIHGPRGPILQAVEPAAKMIEAAFPLEEQQAILAAQPKFRTAMRTQAAKIEAILSDTERSDQETVHQFLHAGLSEIATLFVTAYRVAEDEAKMLAVIDNPIHAGAVWTVERPSWPTMLNTALAARARHFVAAFRPAILRDPRAARYDSTTVRLGEVSEEDAAKFIIRMAGQASDADIKIADLLDLSHSHRQRNFGSDC